MEYGTARHPSIVIIIIIIVVAFCNIPRAVSARNDITWGNGKWAGGPKGNIETRTRPSLHSLTLRLSRGGAGRRSSYQIRHARHQPTIGSYPPRESSAKVHTC